MDDKDNVHTLYLPYCRQVFWKGNYACGIKDDPDRVEVTPPSGNPRWPEICFSLPRQQYELDKVIQLMAKAYEKGLSDRSAAIGKQLRELIAL